MCSTKKIRIIKKRFKMFEILKKEMLNPTVCLLDVNAELIAKKALPGQFVILRATDNGERIPLTIADTNKETGAVTIIFQLVGASTNDLANLKLGDSIPDFVGPLGKATELNNYKKVAIIGGGVGSAIAYPIAKACHNKGIEVHSIVGFRDKDLIILKEQFEKVSDKYVLMTDDGSAGEKGLVTNALEKLITDGNTYDQVIAIGPLIMMKFVVEVAKKYNVPITVSMNPVMIDGTGMCGGCRLTVGGETKFACVDGPDFDGKKVDFDEAMKRAGMYKTFEDHAREKTCKMNTK
jgi:ferredoxin--NADP+ reductase